MSFLDSLEATLGEVASSAIESVTVESRLLPEGGFTVNLDGTTENSGDVTEAAKASFLAIVQPKMSVQLRGAGNPIVVAPWGEPDSSVFWPLMFAGLLVGTLAVYGLYCGLGGRPNG